MPGMRFQELEYGPSGSVQLPAGWDRLYVASADLPSGMNDSAEQLLVLQY
jgi:hypothetical protein